MFQKRLTWFWVFLSVMTLVIIARLAQIQIAEAAHYQALAERILTRRPEYVPARRGAIRDRQGAVLVRDEPGYNVSVHYGALALREDYLLQAARALRERGDYAADARLRDIAVQLPSQIESMWDRLAALTGLPRAELAQWADRVRARVSRWRAAAQQPVREEYQLLPVVENVPHEIALAIALELEEYPWLRVVPGSRRVAVDADAAVHLLGRLGAAGPERIAADPLRGDELGGLRPGDLCGTSGIEYVGEVALRGRRGRIILDYGWRERERTDPVAGHDVHLTIDMELQRHVLALLEQAVNDLRPEVRAGAAAVVLDVATREVLALASYPVYEYERFNDEYDRLRADARHLPLNFRAVQAQYAPGSVCKAITLIGGLSEGVITPQTHFHCTGYLLPNQPDRFRCWIYNLNPGITHDMTDNPAGQDGESAVRNSCNIYFFRVGERLGPERLCEWFGRFGLGRTQGTGLIEETEGIVPTEAWLSDPRRPAPRRHQNADAWNYAIGQGEVTITPLQAANVAATIASGYWAPVRLAYDDTGHAFGAPPAPPQSFDEAHLQVLRRGMWRVVNEPGGTAHRWAPLASRDYELCGKTGSAQTVQRVINWRFTCQWPDGRREEVVAASKPEALALFDDPKPEIVARQANERFPALLEGETVPAHAWFIGFTQPTSTPRGQRPTGRVYAISVVVEFGGSGGAVAGPVVKAIAEYLVGEGGTRNRVRGTGNREQGMDNRDQGLRDEGIEGLRGYRGLAAQYLSPSIPQSLSPAVAQPLGPAAPHGPTLPRPLAGSEGSQGTAPGA